MSRTYITRAEALAKYPITERGLSRLVDAGRLRRYQDMTDHRRVLYRRHELETALRQPTPAEEVAA
ncbi:hypothetical protein EJK80_02420 [Corynebacterium phoceense]|uniref:Helix-turn-helix domain-containing protein n=1 Tax=Corynebacterium phoceense TaxID=1686286 RepID=A0A540R9N8_9CORY|nr:MULTISPECIES: hypothetical protein [Corynebacterium]OFL77028.1 hypothetical protein HMPREF2748_05610 [Corynebacterium sp. HMSC077B05]TQE44452.1 hypothetical protein EJK80_02420 [Corynebacterium phoceense]